jgi:hypothetical protein
MAIKVRFRAQLFDQMPQRRGESATAACGAIHETVHPEFKESGDLVTEEGGLFLQVSVH